MKDRDVNKLIGAVCKKNQKNSIDLPDHTLAEVCRCILANQDFALSIRGNDFETLYINDACLRLFDETREQWMLDNWESRFQSEHVTKIYDEIIPTILAGNKWRGEFEIITSKGEKKQVISDWDTIYDAEGEIVCFYGLYTEVTHMKFLKQELSRQNSVLNEIIDALPDPLVVKDKEHLWVIVNKAFCQITGRTRQELIGKSDNDFFSVAEAEVIWEADNEAMYTGKEIISEESITGKDGETCLFSTKRVTTTSADGEIMLISVARDITNERKLHKSVADSYCQLESSLTALNYDFSRIQDDVADGVSKAEAIRGLFKHCNRDFVALIKEAEIKPISDKSKKNTPAHLSSREYQVFLLLIQGNRIKDIASHLGITANSASTYRSRIMKKLGISSMTDMVQYAIRLGLI